MQRRKTLKRRSAPKAVRGRSFAGKETDVARLTRELVEAREQQTATADVLKIISCPTFDLQVVLDTLVRSAAHLCIANDTAIFLREGEQLCVAAHHGAIPIKVGMSRPLGRGFVGGRTVLDRAVVQVADLAAAGDEFPLGREIAQQYGHRTTLGVPLLVENKAIGCLLVRRTVVEPFANNQIALLQTFANQAVIALENARLLNELRESLQQQTAAADVLKVISSSPGQLEPVFQAMLEKAVQICGAKFGQLFLSEGDGFRAIAMHDVPKAFAEKRRREPFFRPSAGSPMGRVMRTKQVAHIVDVTTEQGYAEGDRALLELAELGGARTTVAVPMLNDNELVGAISIYHKEIRPFTDKQIELVTNFAAQAVIAIENTRLLSELRESLQQQTATADVLKVISRSTFDLQIVLDALIESATRLCGATRGHILQFDGEFLVFAAAHGAFPGFTEYLEAHPFRPGQGTIAGRAAAERRTVHVRDVLDEPGYELSALVKQQGYRTVLAVPMLREEALLGVITILKTNVEPFTNKQIELVTTFADQAVIAIENTRLLNELRQRTDDLSESLEQQIATSDVLGVISRSAFDLQPIFETVAESAVRLCGADKAVILRFDGELLHTVVAHNASPELAEFMRQNPIRPGPGSTAGRAALERRTTQIADVMADPEYTYGSKAIDPLRTVLAVPMLKGDELLGVILTYRLEVKPFSEKQIALVETFADQAVIAIENVRLFDEVQTRTRDLAKSLEELRTTQDRLVQTQKLALLGQLTAGIAHEIKNPLNFVNNFSGISAELIGELQDTLKGMPLDDKARTEINELTDTLKSNFDKVVHHGRRADAIVKNMLQHSREGSGEHRVIDINALVEESLNLAWHGARAETQGFEVKLKQSFDPSAGGADVFPQDIRRALLNLIANGFYAATRRRAETNGGDYEPTLTASTKNLGDRVEVRIRDNGTGMTPDVKEKMFNPFFTTKPTGEGTGLGLSISHDIIVKQHAGSIEVDTQLGEFTEIRIILPRTAVFL